jgi:hypothetical protein
MAPAVSRRLHPDFCNKICQKPRRDETGGGPNPVIRFAWLLKVEFSFGQCVRGLRTNSSAGSELLRGRLLLVSFKLAIPTAGRARARQWKNLQYRDSRRVRKARLTWTDVSPTASAMCCWRNRNAQLVLGVSRYFGGITPRFVAQWNTIRLAQIGLEDGSHTLS